MSDVLLLPQFVWILSVLCGTDLCWGFVYDRPKRSGEDGTAAKAECEYVGRVTGKQGACLNCLTLSRQTLTHLRWP